MNIYLVKYKPDGLSAATYALVEAETVTGAMVGINDAFPNHVLIGEPKEVASAEPDPNVKPLEFKKPKLKVVKDNIIKIDFKTGKRVA